VRRALSLRALLTIYTLPSPSGAALIYLKDSASHTNYLIDTGAAISLIPFNSSLAATGPAIVNANGSAIPSWNFVRKHLKFGKNSLVHSFLQAKVSQPILGLDFLSRYGISVDCKASRVLFPQSKPLPVFATAPPPPPISAKVSADLPATTPLSSPPPPPVSQCRQDVLSLLARYPAVTCASLTTWPTPRHHTTHSIHTACPPIAARARRLSPEQLSVVEKTFKELESLGIVRRSDSPWSSPLHMVPKPNGSWQPCGDYRRLNAATTPDRYPLPNLQDLSNFLNGSTIFSKIDLEKGYHQIPMQESDIPKTAIITPFGLFEFLYMPFGLSHAAQTFQRLMDSLFRDFPFVLIYLGDMLIFSRSRSEDLCHLDTVLAVLAENGLHINPAKCQFAQPEVDFLGHHVTASGLSPIASHTPILDFPTPSDVKMLQKFLGMQLLQAFSPRNCSCA
jgi:hypothetical protein